MKVEHRAIGPRVCDEKNEPLDAPVPLLECTSSLESLKIPDSGLRLNGNGVVRHSKQCVPRAPIAWDRQRHLGEHADGRRELAAQSFEQGQLTGIEWWIPAGNGAHDEPQAHGRARPTQLLDGHLFQFATFDSTELGMRHSDASARFLLAHTQPKSRDLDLSARVHPDSACSEHGFRSWIGARRHFHHPGCRRLARAYPCRDG